MKDQIENSSSQVPQTRVGDACFDQFAAEYDANLEAALAVSGEGKEFYANGRVDWLAHCLKQRSFTPSRGLDFGCGIGSTAPALREKLNLDSVLGVDVSPKSIATAVSAHYPSCEFAMLNDARIHGEIDVAYCNGVFHHIPLAQREAALAYVYDSLKPGGIFALWENNPWNLGTRYVMSHCAFDRDAKTITPPAARRLLRNAGFEILRTDFLFYFPKALSFLRPLERLLIKPPLGAQYQVLAQKPASPASATGSTAAPGAGTQLIGAVHRRVVHSRRISVLADALSSFVPPHSKLLDVGCGDGHLSASLKTRVPSLQIEGVETHARPTCEIPCRLFDGVHLPFADNAFDGCMFVDVLHHTTEPEKILRDACRVSRDFILIKDHLSANKFDHATLRFMDWVGNRSHGVTLPYNYLTQSAWDRLFQSVGLQPAKTLQNLPLYPFPFSLLFGRHLHFVLLLKKASAPSPSPSLSR